MQKDLGAAHPLLEIQILGINERGLEFSNDVVTADRDIPWLQDVDLDGNGTADVGNDLWDANYRDVIVLDGDNSEVETFNLTSNDLAEPVNYDFLREVLIDAAMATQKPWTNETNALDVNNDGFVHPLDVLLVINKINQDGSGELPAPTGTDMPDMLYDCSGDNLVSALDVIQIINFLNSETAGNGEGELVGSRDALARFGDAGAKVIPSSEASQPDYRAIGMPVIDTLDWNSDGDELKSRRLA